MHTKGKWHRGLGNGAGAIFADEGRCRLEQGGTTLYPIALAIRGWDEAEDEANARLIAQAPAMLDLLIRAVEASGFSLSGPTDIRAAEDGEPAWVCDARFVIAEVTR